MHRCNVCKTDFTRKDNLARHQNTVCRKSEDVQSVLPVKRTHINTTPQKIIETSLGDEESSPKKKRLDYDEISEQELDDSPDIQFLPGDIEELQDRAKEILKEFGNGKFDNNNELVTILDNLKGRGVIKSEDYRKVTDYLSSKLQSEEEEEEEEKDVESRIIDTLQYLIQHDMKEIEKLLELFVEKGGTDVEEDVELLGNLFRTWIQASIHDKETMLIDIKRLLNRIYTSNDNMFVSKVPRLNVFQFEKILNDIIENHHRVDEVIRRLDQENSAEETLNRLYVSKYINNEQYENLKVKIEEGKMDLDEVIFQLKQFKVGQGLSFLPRLTSDLINKVKEGVAIYAKEKSSCLRKTLHAMLNELLERKAISKRDYRDHIERYEIN